MTEVQMNSSYHSISYLLLCFVLFQHRWEHPGTHPAVVQLLCFYNDGPTLLPWNAPADDTKHNFRSTDRSHGTAARPRGLRYGTDNQKTPQREHQAWADIQKNHL